MLHLNVLGGGPFGCCRLMCLFKLDVYLVRNEHSSHDSGNKLVKTEEEVDNSVLSSLQKELKKNSKKNEQVDVKVKVEPETKEEKSTTEDLTLNFK